MKEKNKFFEIVENSNNILISGHVSPDGDSIGSSFGLALILRDLGKNVKVVKNDDFSETLNFLYRDDLYFNNEFTDIDTFISVDCASIDRLGLSREYFDNAKNTITIDHHVTNTNYSDLNIVWNRGSACEVVTDIILSNNIVISKDAATYLYLGIVTDTYRFNYPSSTADTLRTAANLLDFRADKLLVHNNLYEKLNPNTLLFQSELIKTATYIGKDIIVAKVSNKLLSKYNLKMENIEGVVSKLRSINGIEISAIVKEYSENQCKYSFRSGENVDVSKIALEFGGGGHVRASGATVNMNLDSAFNTLVNRLEKLNENRNLTN